MRGGAERGGGLYSEGQMALQPWEMKGESSEWVGLDAAMLGCVFLAQKRTRDSRSRGLGDVGRGGEMHIPTRDTNLESKGLQSTHSAS